MSDTPDAMDLLAGEYVLGTLAGAERDAFEERLLLDPAARAEVAAWRGRLGALEQTVPEVAPPPHLWEAIRARVVDRGPNLTIRADGTGWEQIHPGVVMKRLSFDQADGRTSFLLRLMPGASVPAHDHPADEECLVMEGAIAIGDLVLAAGDYHRASKGLPHPAIASASGALLFVRSQIIA
jgi:anti-sigma factor ChrR (cupin superfamily)